MAHEISHVALRHGTAQASKATKYEIGHVAGAVLGAIIGGGGGQRRSRRARSSASAPRSCASAANTRSRPTSSARRSWRAPGYDPRDMANMFKTIQKQGGSGRPAVAERSPEPRQSLRLHHQGSAVAAGREPVARYPRLREVQAHLQQMSARADDRTGDEERRQPRPVQRRPAAARPSPATSRGRRRASDLHGRQRVPGQRAVELARAAREQLVTFAPDGALRHAEQPERVHARRRSRASRATRRTICRRRPTSSSVARAGQSAPRPSRRLTTRDDRRPQRPAHACCPTSRTRPARTSGLQLFTTLLQDGTLFYLIGVAPDGEFNAYEPVFRKVAGSVQFLR